MPLSRNYASTAVPFVLDTAINASQTTLTWAYSVTPGAPGNGWPGAPQQAVIERGTSNEELVLCTFGSVTGAVATWTVTRGYAGTTAKAHPAGAKVEHVTSSIDFEQFRDGTHVITGEVPADITAARLPRSYPTGFSRMYVVDTGGWPSSWGWVHTTRQATDVVQTYKSVVTGQEWFRNAYSNADAWQPWRPSGGVYLAELNTIALATPGQGAPGLQHAHAGPTSVHPTNTNLITAPAGKHIVIKKLKVGRWGGQASSFYLGVTPFGHIAHVRTAVNQTDWWDTSIVLAPGETFYVADSSQNSVNIAIEYCEYDQALFPVFKFFGGVASVSAFRQLYNNVPENHVITSIVVRNYPNATNTITIGQNGVGSMESHVMAPDTTEIFEPLAMIPGGQGLWFGNTGECYVFVYGYKKLV